MATREDILAELNRRQIQSELESRGVGPAEEVSFSGASVIEPVLAAASGMAGEVVGGLAGIVQSINPWAEEGAGAEASKSISEALTYEPSTPAGKEGLKTLGDIAKKGVDIANFPISGLAGLMELAAGQGIEQAVTSVKGVQKDGAGKTAGARALDATGSPLVATAIETAITGAGDIAGLKGAAKATASATGLLGTGIEIAGLDKLAIPQSATKQRIAALIKDGSTDVETAGYKLTPGSELPKTRLESFLKIGGPKIQKDKIAMESLAQGFDPGVVAAIKGSTLADKAKFIKMTNIMEKGKKNTLFAVQNRPGDVVGSSLMKRVQSVQAANKRAGEDLGRVINSIKSNETPITIDVTKAAASFKKSLDEMGIVLDKDNIPNFDNADIDDLAGPMSAINRVVKKMDKIKNPTAANLHQFKKQIDEMVSFGKGKEGLGGKVERTIKALRHDINAAIGDKHPEYAAANKAYSETIQAIDNFQSASGKSIDLSSPSAATATGTTLRRLMGNGVKRGELIDAVKNIEDVANKYGRLKKNADGNLLLEDPKGTSPLFPDDIITQVLFADELDSMFGPVARTSFQGQIGQAVNRAARTAQSIKEGGVISAGIEATGMAADKIKGINQENAFKSMRQLLKDS